MSTQEFPNYKIKNNKIQNNVKIQVKGSKTTCNTPQNIQGGFQSYKMKSPKYEKLRSSKNKSKNNEFL